MGGGKSLPGRTSANGFRFPSPKRCLGPGSRSWQDCVVKRPAEDLVKELERTRDETLGYYTLSDRDLRRAYAEGKWSVKFILHHLAESELILYERIGRTVA